jgi:alpha-1,2-mannosyltransferase
MLRLSQVPRIAVGRIWVDLGHCGISGLAASQSEIANGHFEAQEEMNFKRQPLHGLPTPQGAAAVRGHFISSARNPLGRAIAVAGLIVLALIPLNVLQYKLLGWSLFPLLKDWLFHFRLDSSDSWKPMRDALDYARTSGAATLYQEIFFNRHVKFQYPPTALLPMRGLQVLGIDTTDVLLNNINRAAIALNAAGVGWLFRLVLSRTQGEEMATSPVGTTGAVLAGAATLLFYPVMMAFWLGQIQLWIDTGFTFACIAVLSNRKLAAGALVGLICLLKPQFGVFALWAVLRGQWRFVLGAAITMVPCALISLALFGLSAHLDYLHALSFLSQRGEDMITNNSVNGILNVFLGTGNPLVWEEHKFPPYNPVVHLGSLAAAVVLIGIALWPRRQRNAVSGLLDFQFAALAFTMAAPIAWEHHYGIMAPILAALFCLMAAAPESARRRQQLTVLAVIFLLSALCVTTNKYTVLTALNLAVGYLFFAGLGVLAMLWWVGRTTQEGVRGGVGR